MMDYFWLLVEKVKVFLSLCKDKAEPYCRFICEEACRLFQFFIEKATPIKDKVKAYYCLMSGEACKFFVEKAKPFLSMCKEKAEVYYALTKEKTAKLLCILNDYTVCAVNCLCCFASCWYAKGKEYFLNFIKKLCPHCPMKCGQVDLAYGHHEISIKVDCPVHKVYLSIDCCNHTVCGCDMTMVGHCITNDGFLIIADVKSDSCKVDWLVKCCDLS